MPEPTQQTASRIQELLALHPDLADRLARQLLIMLHNKGLVGVDEIYDEARRIGGQAPLVREEEDPNAPSSIRWEGKERDAVREATLRFAATHLTPAQVEDALNLVRRREEAESLETLANLPNVPFKLLADGVKRFAALPTGDERLSPSEVLGIRVVLIRNFISDELEFIGVAKNYLRIANFGKILDRIIGPERGSGRIGGKAAGMFLGYRILQGAEGEHQNDPAARVFLPESWFLRSDVIEEFLRINALDEFQNQKYKEAEEIRNEYPLIRQVFRNAEFPPAVVSQLERLLVEVGNHPLIVRSSSLLEDRFGAAFSGMYASIFLGNQGPLRSRLQALLGAVAEVFASTLGPDPILYRRRHNLIDYNEDMAVLIQKVVGRRHGKWFLPDFGGVAYSRNEYRWSPRIRPEDGIARLVLGLGTRAVDTSGNDYPRLVALGTPRLRPEVTTEEILRYSQRLVDVIDLEADRFRSVPLADLLDDRADAPGLDLAASVCRDGAILEPAAGLHGVSPEEICVTFDRLLSRTPFASLLKDRLRRLEDVYGVPINVEFAQVENDFYLLQCRPLIQVEPEQARRIPRDVPKDRMLFTARGIIRSGEVRGISHIVLVDPRAYDAIESLEPRTALGRVVARINDALEGATFILMGPGRWGSNDSRLGVRVSYADINHCRVLIEIALKRGGLTPEVSYGTHFFQELVEDGIFYLALYPEEEDAVFNEGFFRQAPNSLADLVPRDAEMEGYIKLISVERALPGKALHLVMDGEAGEALCWFE